MYRVLHTHSELNWGGVETWLMHVMRRVDPKQVQFDFLVNGARPAYADEVRAFGGRILEAPPVSKLWKYMPRLRQVLRECGPYDVIHSHYADHNGVVLRTAAKASIPTRIAHSHLDIRPVFKYASWPRKQYFRLNQAWIQRFATHGVATSANAAASLFGTDWEHDSRWSVLPSGIDLGRFEQAPDAQGIRAELGIAPDDFVIGHVGRFVPQKNHDLLFQIILETTRRLPSAKFLLVGEGPLQAGFRSNVQKAGLERALILLDNSPDIPRVMQAMNAFVFPSFFEGLGMVVVEAQASALPCVIAEPLPQELDALQRLVRRLPLSEPASVWAEALLSFRRFQPRMSRSEALDQLRGSNLNIDNTVCSLQNKYTSCSQPA